MKKKHQNKPSNAVDRKAGAMIYAAVNETAVCDKIKDNFPKPAQKGQAEE